MKEPRLTKPTKSKAVAPCSKEEIQVSKDYLKTLASLKKQILEIQQKTIKTVNQELIKLYWRIGKTIAIKEKEGGWGAKVIDKLDKDLRAAFPKMKGFSPRNLLYMRQFAVAYPYFEITQQPVAQIPWGHNLLLLTKLRSKTQRIWYAKKTIEFGWSRSALESWIKSDVYNREGKAVTNFSKRLPDPHSKLAQETLKDPYWFDYLELADDHSERQLEQGLIEHIQKTLMELGQGFSFVGRQVLVEVGEDDFYIDLLFYHLKLRCYVVVELKNTPFKPEYAGKLNFYLSAVDEIMRHPDDRPTIGMLFCKTKNNLVVEYALRDVVKPIGVSVYETKLLETLPKEYKGALPTVKEIEAELEKDK